MPRSKTFISALFLTFIALQFAITYPAVAAQGADWRQTSVRVIIDSTSDWGRILFDDFNGTNSNGIGLKSVVGVGWLYGKDFGDTIDAGAKIPWQDQVYNQTVVRHGDLVGFFKGLNDFHYTEAYADLVLNVNVAPLQIYIWLMSGGNGTTTFEITSPDTGGTIWRDIIVGNGVTQQVRRIMSPEPFFHPGRTESLVVILWLVGAISAIIIMNSPVLELVGRRIRRLRRARSGRVRNRR